jgi:signal transduction histidine kinase
MPSPLSAIGGWHLCAGSPVCDDVAVSLSALARFAVLGTAVAAGLESLVIASRSSGTALLTLSNFSLPIAGFVVVLCGTVAIARRWFPEVLLIGTGFAWLTSNWDDPWADGSLVFTVGLLVSTMYPVVLAHTALGCLTSRLALVERVALGVGYASALVVSGLGPAIFFNPADRSCHACPANLLDMGSNANVSDALTQAGIIVGVIWSASLVAVLVAGLFSTTHARRVAAAWVALPAIGCLAAVLADYVYSLDRGYVSDDPVDQRLVLVQAVALAAAGVGSLWPEVQRRRVRSKVTDLVLEVAAAAGPGQLAQRLGSIVGDPDLRVLYPLSDGRIVDATGAAARPGPGQVTTALVRRDDAVALLAHRLGALDVEDAPAEIAAVAQLALDNERLHAEASAHLAELRSSRLRILEVADAERRRLERDLHDGAQQQLVTLSLSLRLASLRAGGSDPAIDRALADVGAALVDLRRLARGLFPRELADEGLAAALDTLRQSAAEQIEVRLVQEDRLDRRAESTAYYAVAFLTRAGTAGASVSITHRIDRLRVEVQLTTAPPELTTLDDRVRAVGGSVSVGGEGYIVVEVPCVS